MAMLEQLISTMEKDGPPWLALPRSDGRFLKLLAWVSRAQKVLEIGTSHGYGAIWLAAGLEETGGYLTTVEILAERMALARQHVEAAGLGKLVTFKEGDAHEILPTLQGPFDLVYINADKDGLPDYFSKLVPTKLSASGLLLAYGAIKQQEKMKPYLDMIQGRSDFTTVLLSTTMEDGFCVSARRTA
jgi:predicted O-methyltransferase YrrM